jgi:hypothetical protein
VGKQLPLELRQRQRIHKRDALGTWLLSILAGHHRYAQITALRSDGLMKLEIARHSLPSKIKLTIAN